MQDSPEIDDKDIFEADPEPDPLEDLKQDFPAGAKYLKALRSTVDQIGEKLLAPKPMIPFGTFEPVELEFICEQWIIGSPALSKEITNRFNDGWHLSNWQANNEWLVVIFSRRKWKPEEKEV
jgi:hypothetical protein